MDRQILQKCTEQKLQNNFFVEGLQGAGKTTFVQRLSDKLKGYKVFREGDYSPVELAWCAYVTEEQYSRILAEYPSLRVEIQGKTVVEDSHKIICYTQIITDVPDFHKNMEKFEIYNGNLDKESFENVILNVLESGMESDRFLSVPFCKILSKIRCCIL